MYQPLFKLRTHVSTTFKVKNTGINIFQVKNTRINHFSSTEHTYRLSFVAPCCDSHPFSVFSLQQESLSTGIDDTTQMWTLEN